MRDVCFGEMLGCELQFYPCGMDGHCHWGRIGTVLFYFLYPLELNSKGMMKLNCDQLVLGG